MLLQHLIERARVAEPAARLPAARTSSRSRARRGLLYFVRRYAAKLLYELEFHRADDPTAMRPRYVELLGDALKIAPSPTDYLADIDPGFYVTEYLRSWAFEAQLRDYLREEFGNDWFARREAGSLLRELWSLGQRYRPPTSCSRTSPARGCKWPQSQTAFARCSPRTAAARQGPNRFGGPGMHRPCIGAYSVFMNSKRVVIMGAGGRDFHNFNVVFRPRGRRGRRLHGDADPRHRRPPLPAGARRAALSGRHPDPAGGRADAT